MWSIIVVIFGSSAYLVSNYLKTLTILNFAMIVTFVAENLSNFTVAASMTSHLNSAKYWSRMRRRSWGQNLTLAGWPPSSGLRLQPLGGLSCASGSSSWSTSVESSPTWSSTWSTFSGKQSHPLNQNWHQSLSGLCRWADLIQLLTNFMSVQENLH